jgi:aerotaxis receptor
MKINLPVTDIEHPVKDGQSLISTTNLKGLVTYANQDFVEVSGFSTAELIGKNHNMVRHPDMPVEAFKDLWDTLKSGKPWMGIVKNRCKNGNYYWVDAYVTPIYEKDQITGYQSVRVKPTKESVKRAEKLYAQLSKGKKSKFKLPSVSLSIQLLVSLTLILGVVFGGLFAFDQVTFTALLLVVPTIIAVFAVQAWILKPLATVIRESASVVDNPLAQQVYIGSTGDSEKPLLAIRMLQARLRTVLGRITDASADIVEMTAKVSSSTEKTTGSILKQQQETAQVSTAMNEMSIAVLNVTKSIHEAAAEAAKAHEASDNGLKQMDGIINAINKLSEKLADASTALTLLEQKSDGIGVVLDVIKSIAEQTNLLALNAAIEAARAGDQGRGFAVVADEVRSLAQRTQQSTEEIAKMIPELQAGTQAVTLAMDECCSLASTSVEQATTGSKTLDIIADRVTVIDRMNEQIATAAEEQSSVSAEIDRNLVIIGELAEDSSQNSKQTLEANQVLQDITHQFDGMTRQFSP